jgi:hypothetical protein
MMDLARDLLDAQLVGVDERMLGRVDGVLLEVRPGKPPRVMAMEVGALTVARRISPRLARWARAFAVRWLPVSWRPVRIPLTAFRDVGVDIEVDVDDATRDRLLRLERWLSRHIVQRLPGGAKG